MEISTDSGAWMGAIATLAAFSVLTSVHTACQEQHDSLDPHIAGLISKEYAKELAAGISVEKITSEVKARNPGKFQAGTAPARPEPNMKDAKAKDRITGPQRTAHYSVVDRSPPAAGLIRELQESRASAACRLRLS